MSDNFPCPVCRSPTVNDYKNQDEGRIYECVDYCLNGCWQQSYAYGETTERIGGKEWSWHHTETPEERKIRKEDMRRIENFYRHIIGKSFL